MERQPDDPMKPMSPIELDRRWRAFTDAWRRAATRPPERTPEAAARQVLARLEADAGGRWRRRLMQHRALLRWAAAALLLALALGWSASRVRRAGVPATPPPAVAAAPLPLDDGVVLLWLDDDTPLYLTLAPPPRGTDHDGGTP